MFFSGDPSTRKRVALGGRSNRENDRQKLLEQTRLERERRSLLRKQTGAAIKIQKLYRRKKDVQAAQVKIREQFYGTYWKCSKNVDSDCFCPDSAFLRELLFFFNANNPGDVSILVEVCQFLRKFKENQGDLVNLFAGMDYFSKKALVDYRVKQFAYTCIHAVYENRSKLWNQLNLSFNGYSQSVLLLESAGLLIGRNLPWVCKTVGYLLQRNIFADFREIVLIVQESSTTASCSKFLYSLEQLLGVMILHTGQMPCSCPSVDPQWSILSQLLTVPFLWQLFPHLKETFATQCCGQYYIHQMALSMKNYAGVLPKDLSPELPGYACLLGNTLETAAVALAQPNFSFEMATDIAIVLTCLLETLPPLRKSSIENEESFMLIDDDVMPNDSNMSKTLNKDLEEKIFSKISSCFLLQLINSLFGWLSHVQILNHEQHDERLVISVDAACAFLHVALDTFSLEDILSTLAYGTKLVPVLWKFIKRCHENGKWLSSSEHSQYLGEAPAWLLPLSVFCPLFKLMLKLTDNEEFYEEEKPLPLEDIRCLIVILRQVLWQLLWMLPMSASNQVKIAVKNLYQSRSEILQRKVCLEASQLLSQLEDWNSRRQFTPPSDFHADGVHETFISQAMIENTRAHYILKQAPFLVPFTSRVKILASQLDAHRQRHGSRAVFPRNRFRIRRGHILEDAYNQMSKLSEEDLLGQIRVTYINEFGVEEAGIDGGGIFKDFMENITRAAFDCQYGLFKETSDHFLYPNPGSGMIHEEHLQYFHFLGTLLAKTMYEGILVDIPFATFFLSKLKQKYNCLNDLPSLDPELYRHLIFLKNYKGDISELELYFVIVNNEYGEQKEEELLPNGKGQRVNNEDVITFVHLVANHRLNAQIRQQSMHFLRGFHQLMQKEWIDMFNEYELQLLISGSLESLDVDDLRDHTNYAGGYHKDHCVIEMFWGVLRGISFTNQKKFLKFVTGCSRGPLLGFRYLEPAFCIQRAAGTASDEALDRLPTSATCMNLLKLPPYTSKEQLETKLLYAIHADAGFDLS